MTNKKEGESKTSRVTPLGNRIKALRQKHNLSQTLLAEQLQVSHAYIGYLENGQRSGSNEMLKKLAKFFNIHERELIDLRDQKDNVIVLSDVEEVAQSCYPSHIEEFASILNKIEERTCKKIIAEFKEQLHKKLYHLLTPYDLASVKKMVMEIKRSWINLLERKEVDESLFRECQGYINQNEKEIFFQLEFDDTALRISLLYAEQSQITTFENWIGQYSLRFLNEIKLAHLTQPQKVSSFVWFSPSVSVLNKFQYLQRKNIKLDQVDCSENQLNWYIQQDMLDKANQASAF